MHFFPGRGGTVGEELHLLRAAASLDSWPLATRSGLLLSQPSSQYTLAVSTTPQSQETTMNSAVAAL